MSEILLHRRMMMVGDIWPVDRSNFVLLNNYTIAGGNSPTKRIIKIQVNRSILLVPISEVAAPYQYNVDSSSAMEIQNNYSPDNIPAKILRAKVRNENYEINAQVFLNTSMDFIYNSGWVSQVNVNLANYSSANFYCFLIRNKSNSTIPSNLTKEDIGLTIELL